MANHSPLGELRPIPNHFGFYATCEGRIATVWADGRTSQEVATDLRVLSPTTKVNSYLAVAIDGKPRRVHRLVASAYLGECPKGQVTRHLDGNKHNNQPANLCHGSQKDNMADARRHGTVASKLTSDQARDIYWRIRSGESGRSLAKEFGISPSTVSRIKHGNRWQHATAEPMYSLVQEAA